MLGHIPNPRVASRSVLLVVSLLILLGSVATSEAASYYSLPMQSQTTVSSPEVILQNGTVGTSTIYTNNTSAKVSVVAPAPVPTYYPTGYSVLSGNWWNLSYGYRKQVSITNNASSTLSSGYSVSLTANTTSLVSDGKMLSTGDDLRILYWNGSSSAWLELDRRVIDMNTSSTQVWFKTQASIGANSSDGNYYMYYGYPSAVNPPINTSSGAIALVVANPISPNPGDDVRVHDRLQNRLFSVTYFSHTDQSWTPTDYDAVLASQSCLSSNLAWLSEQEVGMLTWEQSIEEWKIVSGGSTWSGTQIEITDNSHYITKNENTGNLTVLTSSTSGFYYNGWDGHGIDDLATVPGQPAQAVIIEIDKGENRTDDTPSPERRVGWVIASQSDWAPANNKFWELFDRACDWVAHLDMEPSTQLGSEETSYYVSGTVPGSVENVDSDYLIMKSAGSPTEYTVSTEYVFSSMTKNTPTQLNFTVVSEYNITSVNATIQVWNYSSSAYVTSGKGYLTYTSTGTNVTKVLNITTNPQFYTSGGYAKIKVTGINSTTTQFQQKTNQIKLDYEYITAPLFESGFETGDFSEWVNGIDYATGCSCTVVTSPIHHGSYAAEFYTDDPNEWAVARNVFDTIYNTLFARCYVRFTSMPASDGDIFRAIFILHEATAAPWYRLLAVAGLKNVGGTAKWYLQYQTGGSFYDLTADTPLPEADKWYCVEIEAIRDGTAGEARLWVDGVELLSATGLDNDEYTSNSNVEVGLGGDPISNATTIYVDCVKVADTYIGLEDYDYVLRVNNTVTDSWQIRLKKYSDSNISRLQNCTIYFHNSTDGTSTQIDIQNGSYINQTGPWYDLGDSETIYIAMTANANSTGTSYVRTHLEIRFPGTTTYLQYMIAFEIT